MRRAGIVAGVLAATLAGSGAIPALAGSGPAPAAELDVTLGSPEIRGVAGDTAASVTIRQRRGADVIATKTFTTDSGGFFDIVLKPVKAGDKLVVVFQGTRTVTVPRLSVTGNAATDTISGHIPTPGSTAIVQVSDVVGSYTKGASTPSYPTNGSGDFQGPHPGLAGADGLELSWTNALGDDFHVRTALTAAEVQAGSAKVSLFGKPGTTVFALLLAGNGVVRATATGTIRRTQTSTAATFRNGTGPVKVKAGDRVKIGGAVGLTVRTPDLAVGTLSLLATCFPNQDWLAGTVFGAGAISYLADGTADGAGTVSGAWAGALSSGTKVKLFCENAKGWAQDMVATVP